jgi:DNA-binding NarL/FixJ family response regulator
MLRDDPGLVVVAAVADGAQAVTEAIRTKADVVLMDLRMPGVGGIEATASLSVQQPTTAVVVLTMNEDDDSVFAALRAGARGYLLKEATAEDITRAVRAVAAGEAMFGPRIADRVISFFASSATQAKSAVPFPRLTDREREVLDLVARGADNVTIAKRLFLSEKTVRNHVSACLQKLQAASRAEAVAIARDAGLGD